MSSSFLPPQQHHHTSRSPAAKGHRSCLINIPMNSPGLDIYMFRVKSNVSALLSTFTIILSGLLGFDQEIFPRHKYQFPK